MPRWPHAENLSDLHALILTGSFGSLRTSSTVGYLRNLHKAIWFLVLGGKAVYTHSLARDLYKGTALMEQRNESRIGVEYSAAFSRTASRATGIVLNLSMVGCRCRASFVVTKGESLGLLIHVPKYEQPLYVALAEVRWFQGQEFGVEFIHMELEDRHRLSEVIREGRS